MAFPPLFLLFPQDTVCPLGDQVTGFQALVPHTICSPSQGVPPAGPSPGGQALTSGPGRPPLTSHVRHPSFIPQPGKLVPAPIHGRCSPPKGAPRLGVSLTVKNRLESQPQAAWASPRTCREGPCLGASDRLRGILEEARPAQASTPKAITTLTLSRCFPRDTATRTGPSPRLGASGTQASAHEQGLLQRSFFTILCIVSLKLTLNVCRSEWLLC